MKAPTLRQRAATVGEQARTEGPAAAEGQSDCRHYWEIETAVTQLSRGVCKLCGSYRQFPNYLPDCLTATEKERYHEWFSRQECQNGLTASQEPWTWSA